MYIVPAEQREAFINEIAPLAKKAYKEIGKVKPSVCIGMACVESNFGWGTTGTRLMYKQNAVLGHKVGSGKTATKYWSGKFFVASTMEEYTIGTHTVIKDAFRSFDSLEQCVFNFYELLNTYLYEKVKASSDYESQMKQIKTCGYMTSSTEVNTVLSLIRQHNLTKYDINDCYDEILPEVKIKNLTSPDKVIDIALKEEGYLEKSNAAYKNNQDILYVKSNGAGGDNVTKYGKEMHDIFPQTMDFPAAWCDTFIDWCFVQAYGIEKAKQMLCGCFDDYTVNSSNYFKKENRWFTKNPVPGDQVFFKNEKRICHTGLIYKVDKRYIYTIEGNTSNKGILIINGGCVAKKQYPLTYHNIAGYGRPKYDIPASCSLGDCNDNVKLLQSRLMSKGYTFPRFGADGDFGNETLKAVKQFRIDNYLKIGSVFDSECWTELLFG